MSSQQFHFDLHVHLAIYTHLNLNKMHLEVEYKMTTTGTDYVDSSELEVIELFLGKFPRMFPAKHSLKNTIQKILHVGYHYCKRNMMRQS